MVFEAIQLCIIFFAIFYQFKLGRRLKEYGTYNGVVKSNLQLLIGVGTTIVLMSVLEMVVFDGFNYLDTLTAVIWGGITGFYTYTYLRLKNLTS